MHICQNNLLEKSKLSIKCQDINSKQKIELRTKKWTLKVRKRGKERTNDNDTKTH